MELCIRSASVEDAESFAHIFREVWPSTAATVNEEERTAFLNLHTVAFWAEEIASPTRLSYVEDSATPGFFMVLVVEDHEVLFDRLFILPELQGRGLGKELVRFAEDVSRIRSSCYLWVTEENKRAQHLYLSSGWSMSGRMKELGTLRWLGMSKDNLQHRG